MFRGENHWSKSDRAAEIGARISMKKLANPTRYWLGKNHSIETRLKISASKTAAISTSRGENHHNWKGGIAGEHGKIRGSLAYTEWRDAVYRRDSWKCKECGCKKNIVAHHISGFSESPELRFDVENGVTLCRSCHAKIHKLNNTHT